MESPRHRNTPRLDRVNPGETVAARNCLGDCASMVPSKSRHSKYLGRSAGIKPVSFLLRFMLGTEIPGTTREAKFQKAKHQGLI